MIFETDTGVRFASRAHLLEPDGERMTAWAERYVRKDPHLAWLLGNFVEADNANDNGHIFPLDDLVKNGVKTVAHKPLNMLHHENYIVGAYAGAEMMYPKDTAADGDNRPFMEALAAMWKHIYAEEFQLIERAQKDGALFFSMEASADTLTFVDHDNITVPYMGRSHDSYPTQDVKAKRVLNNPRFGGGAIIIPPVKPGWSRADIKSLDALIREMPAVAEAVRAGFEQEAEHLSADQWDHMMRLVMEQARMFNTEERKKAASAGAALPDGSFPIHNEKDLRNAIHALGRAKDVPRAKAHIIKRAKALGLSKLLPDSWG